MIQRLLPCSAALLAMTLAGCAPTHRLSEVQLENQSVAVTAPIPPIERVIVGPWPFVAQPVEPPPGEVRRRFHAAQAAQVRLDSAAALVDVPEFLARHTLLESARALGFVPGNDPETSDLVLDVRLLEFTFVATSFDHAVRSHVEADLMLYRADTREVVWQRRVRQRDAVDPAWFGATDLRGRITPRDMTRLSSEAFAWGLEHVALRAAGQMARRLHAEYRTAHR